MKRVILDTGPLVAYLEEADQYHGWAEARFREITGGLITCESVLSEALFLLRSYPQLRGSLRQMIRDEVFDLSFSLGEEASAVGELMERYRDVPMSLADACLVRLSELHRSVPILTLDTDFRIYRRDKRQLIPMISPRVK